MNQLRSQAGFRFYFVWSLAIILLLTSCEAEATPVANVAPPTNTPDITETLAPPVRYVLGRHAQEMQSIQRSVAETALLIPAAGLTEASLLGADYDIIADYGVVDGWQQSPVTPTISLIINPNISPLNDATVSNIVRNGVDSLRIVNQTNISGTVPLSISTLQSSSLKTELANMGYPDGFELSIHVAEIPTVQSTVTELQALNIEPSVRESSLETIASLLVENRIQLALIKWHTISEKAVWTSAVGENNVIDLYQLPISYSALPELNITYADNGFPIASY